MRLFPIVLVLPLLAVTGCVTRTLFINSEPAGARVFVNDREVGVTPLTTGFTYYGVYDVRLEKDGFDSLWTKAKAPQPWWEYPVVDLLVELTGPKEVQIPWMFKLTKQPANVDSDALGARAAQMQELNRLSAQDANEKGHEAKP